MQFLLNFYSFEYTTKTRYVMFKLINFIVFMQIFTQKESDVTQW